MRKRISCLCFVFVATFLFVSLTSDAFAQTKTFENWASSQNYSVGDIMRESVDASSSEITSLEGIDLYDWTAVPTNSLDISSNSISTIESGTFSGLTGLNSLNLGGNNITSIESGDFAGLENLKSIYLWGNPITSIEAGDFDGLQSIQMLSIGNNISSIEAGAFSGLDNMYSLGLGFNSLTSIESGIFTGLGNLDSLNLSFNSITSIESGDFADLSSLSTLNLGGNAISSISNGAIAGMQNLQELHLYENSLSSIESEDFAGLTALDSLDLSDNNISSIESSDFDELGSMKYLYLSSNGISLIEDGALSKLDDLDTLSLWNNDLDVLNLTRASLANFDKLYIDSEEIESLILDGALVGLAAFNEILSEVEFISSASIVGTDFDGVSSLDRLLSMQYLELLTVDYDLYTQWQSDLDIWDAAEGHELVVVPEPASCLLLAIGGVSLIRRKR